MATIDTMIEVPHPNALLPLVGQDVAVSEWIEVSQAMVNAFAEATGDDQWIHTDVERARAGPFGATIAHGYLTLALISRLFAQALHIGGCSMQVNYGTNRVRFPAPLPTASRIRARIHLIDVAPVEGGAVQSAWRVAVEREGGDKPVCVAETLVRSYPEASGS